MCGIVGYIGKRNAADMIFDGLRKLEYRGYDSAGIAVANKGRLSVLRSEGKLRRLEKKAESGLPAGNAGIGHTRWATHGRPSEINAHPHVAKGIAVVHNGIIENYIQLKEKLQKEGAVFKSETDTEVISHLIASESAKGLTLEEAVREALKQLKGSYAIAVISESGRDREQIIGARNESPLILGIGSGEYFLASDIPAVLAHTREIVFLDDHEMVVLDRQGAKITNLDGEEVRKKPKHIQWSAAMAEKEGYRHFMLKEIFEQPRAIADTIRGRIMEETGDVALEDVRLDADAIKKIRRCCIIACGTSWHAALIGKFYIEEICRIPVDVDIASEFRYRNPVIDRHSLVIAISQSGETADTLAAVKESRKRGSHVIAVCNVMESSLAREADSIIYTHAGPEIGVASTKAFTSQLAALLLFALYAGRKTGKLSTRKSIQLIKELVAVPGLVKKTLDCAAVIEGIAARYAHYRDFLYLGRGACFPVAYEGALKLKEISYIHAEGYPAGEMKHGPIALIDEDVPVVILAPDDASYKKVMGNVQEVKARGGRVIAFVAEGDIEISGLSDETVFLPRSAPLFAPFIFTVPLQLLAYHIAVIKGTDVDQPRNLAKSVTVE